MKFRFKYLFVALVFILGISSVSAKEIETDEIDRNTYVIGTHMFTRDTNDNYDGQLTIKLIMLAAKTIEGNDLDDMVIYYKNARGKWIDGVSGEEVNAPDTFEISHTNVEKELDTPEIYKLGLGVGGECADPAECTYATAIGIVSITEDIDNIELYKIIDGEYTLEKTITKEEYFEGELQSGEFSYIEDTMLIEYTSSEFNQGVGFAVRFQKGDKYSGYSNVLEYKDAPIKVAPYIEQHFAGVACSEEECFTGFGIKINNVPEDIENIELYRVVTDVPEVINPLQLIEDEYVLEKTITKEEYEENISNNSNGYIFIQLTNEEYTKGIEYAVRFTKGEDYSYYSNIVEIKRFVADIDFTPHITYKYSGPHENGSDVYDIILDEIPEEIDQIEVYSDGQLQTIWHTEAYNENAANGFGIVVFIDPNDYVNNRVYQVRLKTGNQYSWYSNIITIGEYPFPEPSIEKQFIGIGEDGTAHYRITIDEIPEGIEQIYLMKGKDIDEHSSAAESVAIITPEEYNGGFDLFLSSEEDIENIHCFVEMKIGPFWRYSNRIYFNE